MPKEVWKGLHKLHEEMGELHQVLGKLAAYPTGQHPDGSNWRAKLIEELADLEAVMVYFRNTNLTEQENQAILRRVHSKHTKFQEWGLKGVQDNERK